VVAQGSRVAQRVQSGYLYSYALVMLIGLVMGISWVVVR
jgi:NADH-quinone oxidoreductase subunit L